MIDSYDFGRIVIRGESYTSDVIIYPDRVDPSWWRKEGHRLQLVDIEPVISSRPDLLIIGTGYYGVMKVDKEVEAELKKKGIEYRILRTPEAVELFKSLGKEKRVVAALHLTC